MVRTAEMDVLRAQAMQASRVHAALATPRLFLVFQLCYHYCNIVIIIIITSSVIWSFSSSYSQESSSPEKFHFFTDTGNYCNPRRRSRQVFLRYKSEKDISLEAPPRSYYYYHHSCCYYTCTYDNDNDNNDSNHNDMSIIIIIIVIIIDIYLYLSLLGASGRWV